MTAELPRLLLTRAEAAAACGVSVKTLTKAKKAGLLRAKRTDANRGAKELYSIRDLEAWFERLPDA
jgi:DNA-binding transcriptional MerR regulator